MPLPKFQYIAPKTLDEACSLLSMHQGAARAMAGGTDLVPQMKERMVVPLYVVGLKSIPGLDYVKHEKHEGLKIGGLATLTQVAEASVVKERFALLSEAIMQMASVQVRNIGTVAGNLCNAAPSADSAPSLIVTGAKVSIADAVGTRRSMAVEDFFVGPGETALEVGEILAEVQVPDLPPKSGAVYLKLSQRRMMDLAIVGVACLLTLDGQACKDIKIALGAVAPTPIRAREAENAVKGKTLGDDLLEKAAQAAMAASKPITDIRSSAEYRQKMVGLLTKRAVQQAWEKAKAMR
jgi:aerobic carbon-monoxide dehydrogenase medium subunit